MSWRKREADCIENYNVLIKEYVTGRVEMIIYDRNITRMMDGYELSDDEIETKSKEGRKQKTKEDDEIRRDSLHRSYKTMIDYALNNSEHFKTFITLTFAENITSINVANKHFQNWCRNVKRIYPQFMYLGVPEYQKRGAVHYHIMTNIDMHETNLITKQNENENERFYDVRYWKHGYTSVFDLSLTDDKFSISAYLTKYFYKQIDSRLFGHNKILKSNNMKKPTPKRMLIDSNEFENYLKYLTDTKHFLYKKHIHSEHQHATAMTILCYK